MNAVRRKDIQDIIDKLDELKDRVGFVSDEETQYADNVPESMSMKKEVADDKAMLLTDAIEHLEDALEKLNEAI